MCHWNYKQWYYKKLFYIPATRTKTVTNTQDIFMVNVRLLTQWIRRCTIWQLVQVYILVDYTWVKTDLFYFLYVSGFFFVCSFWFFSLCFLLFFAIDSCHVTNYYIEQHICLIWICQHVGYALYCSLNELLQ